MIGGEIGYSRDHFLTLLGSGFNDVGDLLNSRQTRLGVIGCLVALNLLGLQAQFAGQRRLGEPGRDARLHQCLWQLGDDSQLVQADFFSPEFLVFPDLCTQHFQFAGDGLLLRANQTRMDAGMRFRALIEVSQDLRKLLGLRFSVKVLPLISDLHDFALSLIPMIPLRRSLPRQTSC